jgi:hypothetical protein
MPYPPNTPAGNMHKYLTGFDKYNRELPFYVDNLFTDEEIKELKDIIYFNKSRDQVVHGEFERTTEKMWDRFRPKRIEYMSRVLIEFEIPKHIENKLDLIAKPLYKEPIALCHYNYIEYNKKYGTGENSPRLQPHIDADENLVTINYQLDSNIEWEVVIEGKSYPLKNNQAIIFSAVNQIHWRPKRRIKDGEFTEIISMDWCPVTNYRFLGHRNPIDPHEFPDAREAYARDLAEREDFQRYWKQYDAEGEAAGIGREEEY